MWSCFRCTAPPGPNMTNPNISVTNIYKILTFFFLISVKVFKYEAVANPAWKCLNPSNTAYTSTQFASHASFISQTK